MRWWGITQYSKESRMAANIVNWDWTITACCRFQIHSATSQRRDQRSNGVYHLCLVGKSPQSTYRYWNTHFLLSENGTVVTRGYMDKPWAPRQSMRSSVRPSILFHGERLTLPSLWRLPIVVVVVVATAAAAAAATTTTTAPAVVPSKTSSDDDHPTNLCRKNCASRLCSSITVSAREN